jgi:hypothetical protein
LVSFASVGTTVTGATGTTSVPIAKRIWLQGYQQTSNASNVSVFPNWLYFNNSGANWAVNMGVSANALGGTVNYTISYYSI